MSALPALRMYTFPIPRQKVPLTLVSHSLMMENEAKVSVRQVLPLRTMRSINSNIHLLSMRKQTILTPAGTGQTDGKLLFSL